MPLPSQAKRPGGAVSSSYPYEPPSSFLENPEKPLTDSPSSRLARVCWTAYLILSFPGALCMSLLAVLGLAMSGRDLFEGEIIWDTHVTNLLTWIGPALWLPIWVLSFFTAHRFNRGNRTWVPFLTNMVPASMSLWSSFHSERRSAPSLLGFYYLVLLSMLLLAGLLAALRSRRRPAATDVLPPPSA